ncbi:hypothetical protein QN369_25890, partial [Pseudomonas sp. CCI1.4]
LFLVGLFGIRWASRVLVGVSWGDVLGGVFVFGGVSALGGVLFFLGLFFLPPLFFGGGCFFTEFGFFTQTFFNLGFVFLAGSANGGALSGR